MIQSFTDLWQQFDSLLPNHLFAIADAAQDAALPGAITGEAKHECLFGYDQGATVFNVSPHLVQISDTSKNSKALRWIANHAVGKPSITLLASALPFEELVLHFRRHLEVRLDDGDEMFLAYWDPAILAPLVGQADDKTLYVRGPILNESQCASLLGPILSWWYWDREGGMHALQPPSATKINLDLPLKLNEIQIDQLVEASVPDNILAHLRQNLPAVLLDVPPEKQYRFTVSQLAKGRTYKLEGTGDLTNYVGLGFMWGESFDQHEVVAPILADVKAGKTSFDEALQNMPESLNTEDSVA
jgi:Domain of unknown function (DUF4123)